MTTNYYLDIRRKKADGTSLLKVSINKGNTTSYISLRIALPPSHWDKVACKVIVRADRQFLNTIITQRKQEIDHLLLSMAAELRHLDASGIRRKVEAALSFAEGATSRNTFGSYYLAFANRHTPQTKAVYIATYKHLQRYLGAKLNTLTFEDITKQWLTDFDNYLATTSPARNARNIHLRNIRATFNDAIDNDITACYPFRKYRLRDEPTAHRSLTLHELRDLFGHEGAYVDIYKLIFFLCGINIVDLYTLTEIVNGRIEYRRAKTHKLYSIKVEPEAQAIIDKYRGTTKLLSICERYKTSKVLNEYLNFVIKSVNSKVSTYWMRHTWATIAAELDIPDDTISRALGHSQTSGARVTQVYINFNNRKIDEANRRVIDYVLYNKK